MARRDNRCMHAGFTLLETLCVVAIIGVLVGLLLPAVQSSRERARLISCENNLRNLWLATESYRFKFQVYPAGSMASVLPVANFPADNHQGWLLRIAPELSGGNNLVGQFDYSKSVYDPVNWPIAFNRPAVVVCPSMPSTFFVASPLTDYVGIYDGRDVPLDEATRGAFTVNQFLNTDDFSDGLNHTVLLGEAAEGSNTVLGWTSGTSDTLRTTKTPPTGPVKNTASNISIYSPYGWCLADGTESYEQFVDSITAHAIKTGRIGPNELTVEGDGFSMVSKESALESLDLNIMIEEINTAGGVIAAPFDTSEGIGDLVELMYPMPLFGKSRYETFGVESYHAAGVNMIFVGGNSRAFTRDVDATLFSSIGIRNDAAPLFLDR